MSGIINRGSPEHKAHLAGVEMEKKLAGKSAEVQHVATGPTPAKPVVPASTPIVPPRKPAVEETENENKIPNK